VRFEVEEDRASDRVLISREEVAGRDLVVRIVEMKGSKEYVPRLIVVKPVLPLEYSILMMLLAKYGITVDLRDDVMYATFPGRTFRDIDELVAKLSPIIEQIKSVVSTPYEQLCLELKEVFTGMGWVFIENDGEINIARTFDLDAYYLRISAVLEAEGYMVRRGKIEALVIPKSMYFLDYDLYACIINALEGKGFSLKLEFSTLAYLERNIDSPALAVTLLGVLNSLFDEIRTACFPSYGVEQV